MLTATWYSLMSLWEALRSEFVTFLHYDCYFLVNAQQTISTFERQFPVRLLHAFAAVNIRLCEYDLSKMHLLLFLNLLIKLLFFSIAAVWYLPFRHFFISTSTVNIDSENTNAMNEKRAFVNLLAARFGCSMFFFSSPYFAVLCK